MGWTPPPAAFRAKAGVSITYEQEASMEEVSTIGLDIAKSVFQAHGADAAGRQLFSKRITRGKLLEGSVRAMWQDPHGSASQGG